MKTEKIILEELNKYQKHYIDFSQYFDKEDYKSTNIPVEAEAHKKDFLHDLVLEFDKKEVVEQESGKNILNQNISSSSKFDSQKFDNSVNSSVNLEAKIDTMREKHKANDKANTSYVQDQVYAVKPKPQPQITSTNNITQANTISVQKGQLHTKSASKSKELDKKIQALSGRMNNISENTTQKEIPQRKANNSQSSGGCFQWCSNGK